MADLEGILRNTAKGFATGVAVIADPIGTIATSIDYWVSGAGPSDERALPTVYSHLYKRIYPKPDENVDLNTGYIPRFLGNIGGGLVGLAGLATVYSYGYPTLALAIPVVTGIYSGLGSILTYFMNAFEGEKIKGKYEKADFRTGFRLGYHENSHLTLMLSWHGLERDLTGRNLGKSHINSSISANADKMRRNFSSLAGYVAGSFVGTSVCILTLGIVPAYKSIRDTFKNLSGKKKAAA